MAKKIHRFVEPLLGEPNVSRQLRNHACTIFRLTSVLWKMLMEFATDAPVRANPFALHGESCPLQALFEDGADGRSETRVVG